MAVARSPWADTESTPAQIRDDVAPELTIIVPVHDEEDNVEPLHAALVSALATVGRSYEIIVVGDGSSDATYARLLRLASSDEHLRLIQLRRNYGQSAVMAAGFDHARGEVSNLRNDPADIGLLLEKLDEGFDVFSGWRRNRRNSLSRRLPSRTANWLIGRVPGVSLHEHDCTLKGHRAVLRETQRSGFFSIS